MKPRVMKNGTFVSMLLVILLTAMGCASLEAARHKYFMRGQVLEVEGGTAYLCIGTEQGAKVGQVFTVHRYVKIGGTRGGRYRVDSVGTVRITEVESHMANAQIVTGDVKANDVVDLDNP
jgi:hypothetical protein